MYIIYILTRPQHPDHSLPQDVLITLAKRYAVLGQKVKGRDIKDRLAVI